VLRNIVVMFIAKLVEVDMVKTCQQDE